MSLLGTSLLVVEDTDTHYQDIQQVLLSSQPEGLLVQYILQRTDNLVDTLRHINRGYDLILLDLNLLDSFGFKTFADVYAVASKKRIPVVVMTVLEDLKMGLDCYRAGAANYIVKSWLEGNPLLLHFIVLSSIEINRQRIKLGDMMGERVGKVRPLIRRCKSCIQRIGYSRWNTEDEGKWMMPDEYIEAAGLNFTDGVCPECFEIYYRPQIDNPEKE